MSRAENRVELRARLRRLWRALGARGGEIAYYGAVALALVALAAGAESYRHGRSAGDEQPSLPAVDFAAPSDASAPEERALPSEPEGAQLLRAFSLAPAWNPGLGLWESHPAVDYRLRGDVTCLLAGTVCAVERGGARGGCVELDCGEVRMRYASVAPSAELQIGDALEAGEVIGSADASMPGEARLGAHLHLELIVDGAPSDYAEWVKATPHKSAAR